MNRLKLLVICLVILMPLLTGCSKPSLITIPIKAPEPLVYTPEFQRNLAEDIVANTGVLDSKALQRVIVDYDQLRILIRQHNKTMNTLSK